MKHLREDLLALAATVWLIIFVSPAAAATHFDEIIPGPAAAVYHELVTFQTPGGAVGTELTVVRAVVTQPTTDAGLFRVQPTPGSGRTTADVTVGGETGAITEDGGAVLVATVVAQLVTPAPPVATAFEMVEIIVAYQPGYDFSTGPVMGAETWSLQALQLAGSHHYAGFVGDPCTPVTATNCPDEVTLPRLSVSPASLVFGDVQINLPTDATPIAPYSIENVGTDNLTMTGPFAPASGPFSLSGSFPASLNPMENAEINIQFRPTVLGGGAANQANVDIASNDPGSPTAMSFSGTGVTLNAAFLMDISGSMNYAPDGTRGVSESESRLGHAKQGGFQLFEIYRELTGGQANFGLYGYPDSSSPNNRSVATATTLVSMRSGNAALGPVGSELDAAPPAGGGVMADGYTPMAEGIKAAQADLDTGTNQRPIILLLADGDHNLDSTSGPATPEAWVLSLVSDGIRMFTIAYGLEGAPEVDFDRLEQLAIDTGGEPLPANATEFNVLRKSFRSALKDWLGLGGIDPTGTIDANQEKTHNVCIDRSDYTATFVVDWEPAQQNAISFDLVSPGGEVITPSTPGVSFSSNDTYAFYVIKGERIRGGVGAGIWKMRLTGAGNLPADTKYSYSVLTGTPYKPRPKINPELWSTGSVLPLQVDLSHLPQARYRGLKLKAKYDLPAESFRSFVAQTNVNWERVSKEMFGQIIPGTGIPVIAKRGAEGKPNAKVATVGALEPASSIYEAKVRAIRSSDRRFSNKRTVGEMQLYDDGTHGDLVASDGIFSNNALTLQRDGIHNFHIFVEDLQATPVACLGSDFAIAHYVAVGLTSNALVNNLALQEIHANRLFDPSAARYLEAPLAKGSVRRAIIVTPKDELGNLWGPGRAHKVAFGLEGARAASPVFDQGDGSYLQLVDYDKGSKPRAWVRVGDVATQAVSITELETTEPRHWFWWILIVIVFAVIVLWFFRRSA
jgi:hypothetical protein